MGNSCRFNLFFIIIFAILIGSNTFSWANSASNPKIMIILDGSGSMWGKAGSQTKIDAAKEALAKIVPSLPKEISVGLTVYGHRQKGNCQDIEILVPQDNTDRDLLLKKANEIMPKGMTPIADSIKLVADKLKSEEAETTIILVSDGKETCNQDPCGVVRSLKKSGIKFVLYVVGFDVTADQKKQLSCLAKAGGGKYFDASNLSGLIAAFESVKKDVVKKAQYKKATATTVVAKIGLGKLKISFPSGGEDSLAYFKIYKKGSQKPIKIINEPSSSSVHPLLSGEYELTIGYKNSNFQPPSQITPFSFKIEPKKTTEIRLGLLIFNILDNLRDEMRWPEALSIKEKNANYEIQLIAAQGNDYYFYLAKPLPKGQYDIFLMCKQVKKPLPVATDVKIEEMAESVVTLDTVFQLQRPKDTNITSFKLIDKNNNRVVLEVVKRFDNYFHLFQPYPIRPGNYLLMVTMEGMDQPLQVADNLSIKKGQFLKFDLGF